MASLSWQAASAPRGPTASFENRAKRPARAVAAAMAPSLPTGLPRTTSKYLFWFNKNCAEIALIFGQRAHRFLRSIRIA